MIKRFQIIWQIITTPSLPALAKWQLLWIRLRKRLSRRPSIYTLSLSRGVVFLDLSRPSDLNILNEIFLQRQYHTDYREVIVIDIGAHKGYFTAYALLNGATAVFAYEPEEHNFEELKKAAKTFQLNGCQIFLYRQAVAVHDGELEFYITEQSESHSIYRRSDRQILKVEHVPAYAFQQAIWDAREFAGNQRRLLVKMDVEGAECGIILNTPPAVLSEINEMFLEVHSFAPCSLLELLKHLKKADLEPVSATIGQNARHVIIHVRRRQQF